MREDNGLLFEFWFIAMAWFIYTGIQAIINRRTKLNYRAGFKSGVMEVKETAALVVGIVEIAVAIISSIIVIRVMMTIQ